jgi:hypothetical protein
VSRLKLRTMMGANLSWMTIKAMVNLARKRPRRTIQMDFLQRWKSSC